MVNKSASFFILFFLSLVLTIIWFRNGLIFAGGEEALPFYNLSKTYDFYAYVWRDEGTGFPVSNAERIPYFYFLKTIYELGFPGYFVQSIHFFILMLVGTISFYFLLKITIEDGAKKIGFPYYKYISLLGAIFYLLNPYSMTQIFGRGLYMQYFAFALSPLFLGLYINGLKKKNIIYVFFALIASYIFAGANGNVGYAISLWFVVLLYTLFYASLKTTNKLFVFLYFLLSFTGWLLVNLFWIWPFLKLSIQEFSIALNSGEQNLGSLRGVSRQFPLQTVIRLMHNMYFFDAKLYGEIYFNIIFVLISWIIPIVALFSIKNIKKIPHLKFFTLLFLVSLFISLGSNFPTGWLFEFFFTNIPYLQAFRNPYEKFGIFLLVAYVPFFTLGLLYMSGKIFKKYKVKPIITIVAVMFLVSGIFLWPFWAGIFAAGIKVNTWVKVPDDYIKANDWLNSQKGDFRIFHLPIVPGDGIRYTWQHSYQGVEAGAYIFDKSSIGHNVGFNRSYYSVLLRRFEGLPEGAYGQEPGPESSAFKSDTFSDELSKLNVRYIILHHDIDYKLTNARNPDLDVNYLASQQNISKIATFGKLDIYQVDIPKNIDLVYSPDAQVSFSKINSTEYIVNLKNAKSQTELYLLEVFDPKWEAFIDGHKVNEHSNVFSYANKWKLDKPGDYSMVIKYKPQEFVNKGLMISTWSIVAMLILSLLMKIRSIIGGIVRIVENTWSLRKT